jgi:hypothetical protein
VGDGNRDDVLAVDVMLAAVVREVLAGADFAAEIDSVKPAPAGADRPLIAFEVVDAVRVECEEAARTPLLDRSPAILSDDEFGLRCATLCGDQENLLLVRASGASNSAGPCFM